MELTAANAAGVYHIKQVCFDAVLLYVISKYYHATNEYRINLSTHMAVR